MLLHQMHGQYGITLTVLSLAECVYVKRTDIPPNKYGLTHYRETHADSTYIPLTLQAEHMHSD